ncbi:hypothetical protein AMTR_s00026p00111900 [Amborella trichopoda]|uniref:Uncharacterized protein n=1 Tax=Amborella trichopoda TaxID=13333 RepID=W1PSX9_AMBTC|nr:hypothetical protein AMTR_s00026p00111900 [Amborella trichopoda]
MTAIRLRREGRGRTRKNSSSHSRGEKSPSQGGSLVERGKPDREREVAEEITKRRSSQRKWKRRVKRKFERFEAFLANLDHLERRAFSADHDPLI